MRADGQSFSARQQLQIHATHADPDPDPRPHPDPRAQGYIFSSVVIKSNNGNRIAFSVRVALLLKAFAAAAAIDAQSLKARSPACNPVASSGVRSACTQASLPASAYSIVQGWGLTQQRRSAQSSYNWRVCTRQPISHQDVRQPDVAQMLLTQTECKNDDGSARQNPDGSPVKQPILRFDCSVRASLRPSSQSAGGVRSLCFAACALVAVTVHSTAAAMAEARHAAALRAPALSLWPRAQGTSHFSQQDVPVSKPYTPAKLATLTSMLENVSGYDWYINVTPHMHKLEALLATVGRHASHVKMMCDRTGETHVQARALRRPRSRLLVRFCYCMSVVQPPCHRVRFMRRMQAGAGAPDLRCCTCSCQLIPHECASSVCHAKRPKCVVLQPGADTLTGRCLQIETDAVVQGFEFVPLDIVPDNMQLPLPGGRGATPNERREAMQGQDRDTAPRVEVRDLQALCCDFDFSACSLLALFGCVRPFASAAACAIASRSQRSAAQGHVRRQRAAAPNSNAARSQVATKSFAKALAACCTPKSRKHARNVTVCRTRTTSAGRDKAVHEGARGMHDRAARPRVPLLRRL
jgi:hypothetical protein